MNPCSSANQTKNNQKERNEKADTPIHNAINLRHWYEYFCELFNYAVFPKDIFDKREREEIESIVHCQELDEKEFKKLCKVFKNLYPGIYEGLEVSWFKVVDDMITTEQYFTNRIKKECKQRVEASKIYKYPRRCYWCRNCQSFSHHKSFREPKPEDLPLEPRAIIRRNLNSHSSKNRPLDGRIFEV